MKTTHRLFIRAIPFFALLFSIGALNAATPLESGYDAPPDSARPLTWWHWINGNVTKDGIVADLTAMRDAGIAGVQLFDASIYLPAGPVRYGSDEWHEHVQFAIKTAAKLGMEVTLMNTPGWSASGGPWITPERSMKKLVWTETTIESDGASPVQVTLKRPSAKENFYRDVAVLAVPADPPNAKPFRLPDWEKKIKLTSNAVARVPVDTDNSRAIPRERIINITSQADADGNCRATLPKGRWAVIRFGFTSTGAKNHPAVPEGHGLECDKLDPDAVAFQFEKSVGRIIREAGPLAGKTLTGLLFDSFEAGFQNWTETLPAQFRAAHNYDIMPLLPVFTGRVIESVAFTECVLGDFRALINASLAKNYFGVMQRLAHKHGLIVYAEAQGGPLNPAMIEPYVDVVMNEFWHHGSDNRLPRIKLCASIVNVHNKHILAAEAFSARPEEDGWSVTLASLKLPGDHGFAAGVNRCILHTYAHQPFSNNAPGFTLGRYGTRFGRMQTWWPAMPAWTSYIARSQFLLQQGWKHAAALYLHTEDMGYAYPPNEIAGFPETDDFDIAYPHDLDAMTMRDGRLALPHGPSYRLLITPKMPWAASIATLRKLRDFSKAGLLIHGNPPVSPAGVSDLRQLAEFNSLVAEIRWGNESLRHAMNIATGGLPDLAWDESVGSGKIKFTHRRAAGGAHIYFISNQGDAPVVSDFHFAVTNRAPEIWDAVAGTRVASAHHAMNDRRTSIPLQLAPRGSLFVVFQKTPAATAPAQRAKIPEFVMHAGRYYTSAQGATPVEIDGSWQVGFENKKLGAPARATFDKLISWSDHDDDAIKHYSGAASYTKTFTLAAIPQGCNAMLDIGRVADLAELRVNGHDVATLWTPPFRADITRFLRVGENTLEIRVTNSWVNRLIGDERIPVDYPYQKPGRSKFTDGRLLELPAWLADTTGAQTNPRHTFSTWKHYTPDSPLRPAGLLGPVKIEWMRPIHE
ncbi:glycosyl hydrolase [Ereboglobus luteus]|uniref:Glycosyl hydrolases family 2 sugar binding domain-containing protein n=1 Tax=Ereboglobus luteus TaxID=1796921 RepID=A0A2U8E3L0_9BACT|nr:glycosyl hydrolase [Ereboglobus luteus]AWI09469.1 hypothetical protein CKA38_09610 [Ereboglobus luteus]